MYHSITFTDENGVSKNTWDDWFLIPENRPWFDYQKPTTTVSSIPGFINARHDVSEIMGNLGVGTITGSIVFIVENEHGNWVDKYSAILNYAHGQRLRAVLEDDPSYYYDCRYKIVWATGENWSKVTFQYTIIEVGRTGG